MGLGKFLNFLNVTWCDLIVLHANAKLKMMRVLVDARKNIKE